MTARPDGNALLLRWFLDRQDRPAFPRTQFFSSSVAYAFCEALIQQRGKPAASAALREGRVVLLGLRQDTSTLENKGRGVYDDYIVVLNAWGQRGHAHLFPATTEPTAQYAQRASVTASGARVDARYKDVRFKEAHGADVDKDGSVARADGESDGSAKRPTVAERRDGRGSTSLCHRFMAASGSRCARAVNRAASA